MVRSLFISHSCLIKTPYDRKMYLVSIFQSKTSCLTDLNPLHCPYILFAQHSVYIWFYGEGYKKLLLLLLNQKYIIDNPPIYQPSSRKLVFNCQQMLQINSREVKQWTPDTLLWWTILIGWIILTTYSNYLLQRCTSIYLNKMCSEKFIEIKSIEFEAWSRDLGGI
jgi:hypothetical protein